jgi:hypothetical protein
MGVDCLKYDWWSPNGTINDQVTVFAKIRDALAATGRHRRTSQRRSTTSRRRTLNAASQPTSVSGEEVTVNVPARSVSTVVLTL